MADYVYNLYCLVLAYHIGADYRKVARRIGSETTEPRLRELCVNLQFNVNPAKAFDRLEEALQMYSARAVLCN